MQELDKILEELDNLFCPECKGKNNRRDMCPECRKKLSEYEKKHNAIIDFGIGEKPGAPGDESRSSYVHNTANKTRRMCDAGIR